MTYQAWWDPAVALTCRQAFGELTWRRIFSEDSVDGDVLHAAYYEIEGPVDTLVELISLVRREPESVVRALLMRPVEQDVIPSKESIQK